MQVLSFIHKTACNLSRAITDVPVRKDTLQNYINYLLFTHCSQPISGRFGDVFHVSSGLRESKEIIVKMLTATIMPMAELPKALT